MTIALMTLIAVTITAQSTIDKLFDKYQGKDGFVTVTVNGNMLKFLAEVDDSDDDFIKHANKFTSIKILVQEDDEMEIENFYDMVIDEVNRSGYEEMVSVKSSDEDLKILVKADGRVFKEFLLIAGGDDNAIIQIKGNMTLDDVKEMGTSFKNGHGISGISDIDIF